MFQHIVQVYSNICPIGLYESINCGNRGIGRRNMLARLFLINSAFSAASKLRTPNMYCWSRKTLVAIHWTYLRVNLICIKSFCPQKKNLLRDDFNGNVAIFNVYK